MLSMLMVLTIPPLAADRPPSAKAVVARFAEDFCRPKSNQLAAAKRWKLPGWQVVRSETERGITYAVDGPIAENDVYDDRIGGPVQGGEGFLGASAVEYRLERLSDHSSAILTIEPDTLLNIRTIERLLRTELVADGMPYQHSYTTPYPANTPPPPIVLVDSWSQRYKTKDVSNGAVEVRVRRNWGSGATAREWVIRCANERRVVVPTD